MDVQRIRFLKGKSPKKKDNTPPEFFLINQKFVFNEMKNESNVRWVRGKWGENVAEKCNAKTDYNFMHI